MPLGHFDKLLKDGGPKEAKHCVSNGNEHRWFRTPFALVQWGPNREAEEEEN